MGPIIRQHNGFIDKYIGDAIMGLFENTDDALQAAIDMPRHLPQYNNKNKNAGYDPIRIGVGLNSGQVMLGAIGENDRFETTVIGDVVNLASRIESLSKRYGAPLLISEFIFNGLKDSDRYGARSIGKAKIKGKDIPVRIFEVFDADAPDLLAGKKATLAQFEKALDCYHNQDFRGAEALFGECVKINPDDNIVHYYYLNQIKQ